MPKPFPDHRQEEITRLGLYGLIPFIIGAVAVWVTPFFMGQHFALTMHAMTLAYGGVIAAYMAGIGAGGLLAGPRTINESFLPGMIAVLIAWIAISTNMPFYLDIPAAWRHALVLIVLIYLLLRDLRAVEAGNLPRWYGALRMRLTFWAGLAITAIILRLILWSQY